MTHALRRAILVVTVAATALVATPQPASAATSTTCPSMTDSITRLYSAYFLRAPDGDGFAFWEGEFSSGRWGLERMSNFFASGAEFQATYSSLTDLEFVELIYRNVLGRPAEPAGLAFWVDQLATGARTRGNVMINFSESEEYVAKTGTSVPLAGYFNWYPEGVRFICGDGIFNFATQGQDRIDIIASHNPALGEATAFVAVDSTASPLAAGAAATTTTPLVRQALYYDQMHFAQFTGGSGLADETITVDVPTNTTAYLVSYDGVMPGLDDRSGWRPGERQPTPAEFQTDLDAAVTVVDKFWRDSWANVFTGSYIPPFVNGLYDGTLPGAPVCGGITLDAYNAFYCSLDDSVSWDVNLMAQGYSFGDGFVYLVIAHEWGHAIQARLDPSLLWTGIELQADCFAGAAIYGAASNAFLRSSDGSLIFEPGDAEELQATLAALGDALPWTDPSSHGSAEQRLEAFGFGQDGGIEGCFPIG